MSSTAADTCSDKVVNVSSDCRKLFLDICTPLKIENKNIEQAWMSYQQIKQKITLEGNELHWLVCSLYIVSLNDASSKNKCNIPLSKLLVAVNLSLLHFFQKVTKWINMGKYGKVLNNQIDQLERNFSVSSIVFEKYSAIFKEIFIDDWEEIQKRGKKKSLIGTNEIFTFCWMIYISAKAHYPDISDDLVNSYHLMLCCLDLIFGNIASAKQLKSSISQEFQGLPSDFFTKDYSHAEPPSLIDSICQLHEGLAIESKIIRKQYLGSYIDGLLKSNCLSGNAVRKSGLLENNNYEANIKYLNESYEEHVVNAGKIDERIFIKVDSENHIGTPTKRLTAFTDVDEKERSQVRRNLQEYFNNAKGLYPQTPLTGRRWLENKQASSKSLSITLLVSRLQDLVKGLKPSASDDLKTLFSTMKDNDMEERISELLNNYGNIFLEKYEKCQDTSITGKDFAKSRLHLSIVLFYKVYENFMAKEKKKSADLSIFGQELFVKCLFTCCMEIVIFSYKSKRIFPWTIEIYDLDPYHFFKVIELVIRAEELSREVIKHLSQIEEKILESLSWRTGSPIYDAIGTYGIPRCHDVSTETSTAMNTFLFMSPNPARLNKNTNSPSSTVSPACRNLFGTQSPLTRSPAPTPAGTQSPLTRSPATTPATTVLFPPKVNHVRFPVMIASPGASPVRVYTVTPEQNTANIASGSVIIHESPQKKLTKKYGSLGIFFRKLYHMSFIRMKHLCDNLNINADSQKKIWTCFEQSLVENIDMLRDRHIDQLLMCAVYVMSKVTKEEKSFHEIMKFYRTQPQASSDVYRNVLITRASDKQKKTSDGANAAHDTTVVVKDTSAAVDDKTEITPAVENSIGGNNDENEHMDLIQFYNIIYIKKIKDFALKFASNKISLDAPPLSPLPTARKQTHSPRKLSTQHHVYISPIKSVQMTPRSKLLYCFDSDTPKKLGEINAMVKGGTRRRVNLDEDEGGLGPTIAKRAMNGFARKAGELAHMYPSAFNKK